MKTIIVLSGGGSGSSMLAGALDKMGVEMVPISKWGYKIVGGDEKHPLGYYERPEFWSKNDAILKHSGGTWYDPPLRKQINWPHPEELATIIRQHEKTLWGIKDNRMIFTIHLWEPHLKNPHYIVFKRNIQPYITSILRQQKFNKIKNVQSWIEDQFSRADQFTMNKKALEMVYDNIIENPENELNRLANFIDIPLTNEAMNMILPQYRHFK